MWITPETSCKACYPPSRHNCICRATRRWRRSCASSRATVRTCVAASALQACCPHLTPSPCYFDADAAQLGVFLSPECNVSAIASAVVARDSASRDVSGASRRRASSATSFTAAGDDTDEPSQSEQFVERLDGAVQRIDRVISEHIGEHHATLLDQVGSVDELQGHVTSVQSSVGQLKQLVHSLQALVREQHENLRDTIQRYRNVEQCGDIVRRVLRFQQLSDRVLSSDLNHADASSTGAWRKMGVDLRGREAERDGLSGSRNQGDGGAGAGRELRGAKCCANKAASYA